MSNQIFAAGGAVITKAGPIIVVDMADYGALVALGARYPQGRFSVTLTAAEARELAAILESAAKEARQ